MTRSRPNGREAPTGTGQPGGVGDSASRPDGTLKVTGNFAYSSDLHLRGALWGATLRSPHPRARIVKLESPGRSAITGVAAVLTHEDVPGEKTYGMKVADQPVLAFDEVRYQGEAVAIVAADHPEIARRALDEIVVEYEELPPIVDPEAALGRRRTDPCIRAGTWCATCASATGTRMRRASGPTS